MARNNWFLQSRLLYYANGQVGLQRRVPRVMFTSLCQDQVSYISFVMEMGGVYCRDLTEGESGTTT